MTAEAWQPYDEPDTSEINAAVVRHSFEMIDRQCEILVANSIELLRKLIEHDAAKLNSVDEDEEGVATALLYVSPGSVEAIWEGDKPQETLTFVMESQAGDGTVSTHGDRLEISLPAPPKYVYPDPLDIETVEPTAFLRYIPAPEKGTEPTRYIMQRDAIASGAYRLYEYTITSDTGNSQEIFDDFSFSKVAELNSRRIPQEVNDMTMLWAHFGNFTVIHQTLITSSGKLQL